MLAGRTSPVDALVKSRRRLRGMPNVAAPQASGAGMPRGAGAVTLEAVQLADPGMGRRQRRPGNIDGSALPPIRLRHSSLIACGIRALNKWGSITIRRGHDP